MSAPVPVAASGTISLDLEPGPAVLVVDTYAGGPDIYELYVTADMTLLSEAVAESAPAHERSWVESVMVQLRADARAAAQQAEADRVAAEGARQAAETARDAAADHESETDRLAGVAGGHAADADQHRGAAAGSESNASLSEQSAAQSEAQAGVFRDHARDARDESRTARDGSVEARGGAETARDAAAGSASAAASSESAAEVSRQAADLAASRRAIQVWNGNQWIDADKVRFDGVGGLQEALVWDASLGEYVTVWPIPPLWVDDFTTPTLDERWTLMDGTYSPPGLTNALISGPTVSAAFEVTIQGGNGATLFAISSDYSAGANVVFAPSGVLRLRDGFATDVGKSEVGAWSVSSSVTLRRAGGLWTVLVDGRQVEAHPEDGGGPLSMPDTHTVPLTLMVQDQGSTVDMVSYTEL
ncbi:hypothetical protein [Dietzia alimentaria]|uniref:hypothetical protein n=1 Tax=Dietzia alimentaria TaxID=665550 RepID=UPI001145F63F|nr:hypothetical protein [Dietzia alimentaria]